LAHEQGDQMLFWKNAQNVAQTVFLPHLITHLYRDKIGQKFTLIMYFK
jgi:hypothetical protein